ncbi:hypothetical protein H6P81_005767 [Aristolochia fimbriata]|uniref:Uncharacterized protein n=1 Tax=Aristolochia fimbriata TaxID=158543 RepID=A0AAV7EVW2_ARIFI|nr:hypothetical protein H6P81_005767 [Aristolochia fimbriata]
MSAITTTTIHKQFKLESLSDISKEPSFSLCFIEILIIRGTKAIVKVGDRVLSFPIPSPVVLGSTEASAIIGMIADCPGNGLHKGNHPKFESRKRKFKNGCRRKKEKKKERMKERNLSKEAAVDLMSWLDSIVGFVPSWGVPDPDRCMALQTWKALFVGLLYLSHTHPLPPAEYMQQGRRHGQGPSCTLVRIQKHCSLQAAVGDELFSTRPRIRVLSSGN